MDSVQLFDRPAGGKIISDVISKHPGKGHPRILFTNDSLGNFQVGIASNPYMMKKWGELKAEADKILMLEPQGYVKIKHRLLSSCAKVRNTVFALAIAYHVTGNPEYANRLWEELYHCCVVWPDWNPYHFLDTGEMAMAIAVAYDWLYSYWSDEQKAILENAILSRAVTPILQDYLDLPRERASGTGEGWLGYHNNWSFVCSGGIMCAALAICDEKPEYLERLAFLLGKGIQEIEQSLDNYAPDGGYAEGPSYWNYASTFFAYLVSALISATGKDYGLLASPGLDKTGYFVFNMLGPGGMFNFSDADSKPTVYPVSLFFSRVFHKPDLSALYKRYSEEYGLSEKALPELIQELIFYPAEFDLT